MKKPQKPCGFWGFVTGIYFGHLIWLRGIFIAVFIRVICYAAGVTRRMTQYFACGKMDPDARGKTFF